MRLCRSASLLLASLLASLLACDSSCRARLLSELGQAELLHGQSRGLLCVRLLGSRLHEAAASAGSAAAPSAAEWCAAVCSVWALCWLEPQRWQ